MRWVGLFAIVLLLISACDQGDASQTSNSGANKEEFAKHIQQAVGK